MRKDNSFSDDYHGYSYSENGNTATTEKSASSSNSVNNTNNSNTTQKSESSSNNNSTMPTDPNAISKDEALKLAQNKWGTYAEETGYQIGYQYVAWIKDNNGKEYYVFILRWLVVDHWSYIDTVFVCTDGKTYKEIGSPESYTDGQLVTSFDSEGNF